ncbi:MAG TPA: serine hydrolase [Blastocatellia bacterium]|nr:serine hydrolase [Blastocatellia bacterium]
MKVNIQSSRGGILYVILSLAVVFSNSPALAQQKPVNFAELDKVALEELKQRNTPGAAVAVIKDDRVIYAKGYGVASVETGAPVTPEMLFRLGSTTKMLTAAALVTLAGAGKLKLDAPIGNYVKGLNPQLAQVTAHQLLSQSAGLRDFAATITSNDDAALGAQARSWKEDVFFTEPGKIYSYSSPGYWLAGLVVEEVGGKPYADAMDDLLFKPLGMSRSTLRPSVAMTYPLTAGHRIENNLAVVIRPAFNNTAMWPGGSVYSNVGDLARFVIALMNDGKLEGKQAMAPLVVARLPAPHVTLPGTTDVNYGYGLMSFNYRGVRVVTHGGASTGYGSTIQLAPEHKFAVITLTNRSGETLLRARNKALELLLPLNLSEEEERRAAPSLTETEMAAYVGRYSHEPQSWDVFVKEGKLWLRHEGGESELKRVGPATFAYGSAGELVFTLGPDGKAEHMFLGMYAAKKVLGGK